MELLILLDYRSHFYSSTYRRGASLSVIDIQKKFENLGYCVTVKYIADLDLRKVSYRGVYVLYQSSEDTALEYKSYVEDILLALVLQGAVLIPDFSKFRAHHNKVFMEMLRDTNEDQGCRTISSRVYGTYEEYQIFFRPHTYPVVFKAGEGSKSKNVFLAHTKKEADDYARKLSATPSLFNFILGVKNWFDGKGFTPISNHRKKFIVQDFVQNLDGDYKIVVYGGNYFVLFRDNRPNDFRASGSGRLSFPEGVPLAVLAFAKRIFESFDAPFISMDIGYDGVQCFLFEFQFVMFGQYAVEKSPWRFVYNDGVWERVSDVTTSEKEMVAAVHLYLQRKK